MPFYSNIRYGDHVIHLSLSYLTWYWYTHVPQNYEKMVFHGGKREYFPHFFPQRKTDVTKRNQIALVLLSGPCWKPRPHVNADVWCCLWFPSAGGRAATRMWVSYVADTSQIYGAGAWRGPDLWWIGARRTGTSGLLSTSHGSSRRPQAHQASDPLPHPQASTLYFFPSPF